MDHTAVQKFAKFATNKPLEPSHLYLNSTTLQTITDSDYDNEELSR